MKRRKNDFLVLCIILAIISATSGQGLVVGKEIQENRLKTSGLVIVQVGEDSSIQNGLQNILTILKQERLSYRLIKVDTKFSFVSTLNRYNSYELAIVAHGKNDGIPIGNTLVTWNEVASMIEKLDRFTYFATCYSNSILSNIEDQKRQQTVYAPSSGLIDQKVAALSIATSFLARHGKVEKAITIIREMAADDILRLISPVEPLGEKIYHHQWVRNYCYLATTIIEHTVNAILQLVLDHLLPIWLIVTIIHLALAIIHTASTMLFFGNLGIHPGDLCDLYYDYTQVNIRIVPLVIVIPFIGDVLVGSLLSDTETYIDIYHSRSGKKFRVKEHIYCAGATVGGIITLGLSWVEWHKESEETYTNNGGTGSGTGGGGGGCVARNTKILLADGIHSKKVQRIKIGDWVLGYNTTSQETVPVQVTEVIEEEVSSLLVIVHEQGKLRVTPVNQPIYMRNASYTGWLRDPQNLKIGDQIFHVPTQSWVEILKFKSNLDHFKVYDVVTDPLNDFVGNGILLDKKEQ